MKSWLQDNDIQIYKNKEKSVEAERLFRPVKKQICKYLTAISKNVYTRLLTLSQVHILILMLMLKTRIKIM